MKQIIILNGPPKSGKDELAKHLCSTHKNFQQVKFANELKKMVHRAYNTPNQDPDAYEHIKDIPSADFLGLTPRQAYIGFSENYIKKLHGKDFFGLLLSTHIRMRCRSDNDVFVVSDGGFSEEVEPLITMFGAGLITIVRLKRDGSDFAASGDSRRYVYAEQFSTAPHKFLDFHNSTDTVEEYTAEATQFLGEQIKDLFNELPVYSALLC